MERTKNPNPILSAKIAYLLINNRSILPHKTYLSIKGCITCMSEKMRVKNEDFFLLEIENSVFIIVKDFHLYWHSQLLPQDTFVFYDLRLTTIEKEWLSLMNLKGNFDGISICDDLSEDKDNLVTFTGKVTSVDQASDGIYELNNNIRLILWSNPSVLGDPCPHIGSHIHIYNAHQVQNMESAEGKTLVCCTRTLIRCEMDPVIRMNMVAATKSLRKESTCCRLEDMKSTISKYKLNFQEVESLLRLRNALKAKKRKELLYLLHNLVKSFCCGKTENKIVSILDLFLRHDDLCPFVSTRSSDCRIKSQVTINSLKEYNWAACADGNGNDSNSTNWQCRRKEWKNGDILIGSIRVNKEGQPMFVDQSGEIPVVFVNQLDNSVSHESSSGLQNRDSDLDREHVQMLTHHKCSLLCQTDMKPAMNLSCPIFTAGIVGKMLYIRKFNLVSEQCFNEEKVSQTTEYLIFSLQDCVVLETITHDMTLDVSSNAVASSSGSSQHQNHYHYVIANERNSACYIYVLEKQQLCLGKNGYYFKLHGRMLDPSLITSSSKSESLHQKDKEDEMVRSHEESNTNLSHSCDVSYLKRKFGDSACLATDQYQTKKMKCFDLGSDLEINSSSRIQSNALTSLEFLSQQIPVTMYFRNENVCHFPSIYPGLCYQMTSATGNAFQPVFSNEKLGKAVNRCGAKVCIETPKDIEVNGIPCDSPAIVNVKASIDKMDKLSPLSVVQILSDEFQESLVSFTAVIRHREVQHSYFASSKDHKGMRDMRLDLCDFDPLVSCHEIGFEATISLYFDSSQMLYVLGLIPGSVIDVTCVERKISKNNSVYCRFTAVSSLHVICFVPNHGQNRLDCETSPNSTNLTKFLKEYIATIWNHGPGISSQSKSGFWHIHVHICVIFSLKLELTCKRCRSLFVNNRCQSRGCDNTSFDIIANCVILVEDGTCQAIVKLRKPNLVRKLLTLNDEQWGDVVSLILDTGHIYISKQGDKSPPSNCLGMFLEGLMASTLVVRPAKMLVRVFKDSPCRKTVNNMEEKVMISHQGSNIIQLLSAGNKEIDTILLSLSVLEEQSTDWLSLDDCLSQRSTK